ncbi:MAG: DUF1232 domain-containing protein [Patescibacteria group bacterium]|nr:DUF1232 domain-containing protein [Patescibacteria group bacterium]
MKTFFVVLTGIVAFLYLLNPTAGIFEFIPDNIPIVGNLDEAGATALIIATLGYFGIDFAHMFKRKEEDVKKETIKEAEFEEVEK